MIGGVRQSPFNGLQSCEAALAKGPVRRKQEEGDIDDPHERCN
jgi:hypothetical protein